MTLCVPCCTYFPLLPLLIEPIPINNIQNFVDTYDQNRFIASCRIAAYRNNFRRFSDVAMADFDDEQIQQFINNWFHGEDDQQAKTSNKCWELLEKPENQAAKELAHTPLLLTFLCLVYDRSQNFPNNRSVLYKNALRILLEEWAAEKRILQEEIYQGLHTELEELLLSEIAYTGFASNRLFFSQSEIVDQIKTFLAGNLNAPQHLNGEAVLNAIAIQQGILVERARDVFSFSHLTLQEYLTAQYIDDHRLVEKLVNEHLTDKPWKEVFLLVAGVMRGGADELLLLMEKEAQQYINTPKLQALLNWAEEVTVGSPGDYKPVGKRAVAIAISNLIIDAKDESFNRKYGFYNNCFLYANLIVYANSINTGHEYAYIIAMIEANKGCISDAIDYTHQLKELAIFNKVNFTMLINRLEEIKSKVPDEYQLEEVNLKEFTSFNNLKSIILTDTPEGVKATVAPDKYPSEEAQIFINILMEILINGFNLTPEMINLSQEEIKALDNYLYANYLIIQCKEAAVRVSPATWEAIEARMLLVGNN